MIGNPNYHWDCWRCNFVYYGEEELAAYRPVGSVVVYDVCYDCWEILNAESDED